ncbi:arylsulfotransferase family protein [Daejeonella sp. H1SJ63]|jgi:hypothetical protein|uniref:arylsulfotransferase family protein n=1 Tax=Daejeonella sp. H1SJ63 TaxID=3034145 RepID=UPI0023EDDC3D|nr:arylsulfotransferase family protein [Daejeonella sp. H1SJ63]
MNKKVPVWFVLLIIWFAAVGMMMFGWAVAYIHEGGHLISGKPKTIILSIAKFPALVNTSIRQVFADMPVIIKDRYPGISGLQPADKNYRDSSYLLLSAFDKEAGHSAFRLIRLSDQKVLHKWVPDIRYIMKLRDKGRSLSEQSNIGNLVLWHPLPSADGSLIFNTEDRSLIKIDRNSKVLWSLDGIFHHSQEFDAEGNIWASSVIEQNKPFISRYFKEYRDDALAQISPEGTLLKKLSISKILLDNGYRGLLFGIGPMEKDPIHLNDIQPALSSGPYWEKGDLLVSIRNKSTVFLYRPSTNKILWLQTGPWLNQHDADFIDDHRISIFGNNIIRNASYDFIDGHNEVYVYDFSKAELSTPYTEFLKKAKVRTMTGGRSEILPNGDVFIEETDFGRMLRGNSRNTIWQYVERVDENSASVLGWSRILNPLPFTFLNN